MDLMTRRRALLAQQTEDTPTDLLANVEWTEGYFISQANVITANANAKYCDFAQVLPNRTYILKGCTTGTALYDRVHAYRTDQTWIRQIAVFDWLNGGYTSQFTTPDDCRYIRISTEIATEVHMYLA